MIAPLMSSRGYTLHPTVSKLFVDAVKQLMPELDPPPQLQAVAGQAPRLTHEQGYELLELAIQLTGRADLGVLAAEAAEPGHFELVEVASRTQGTVREAIETLIRLWPMSYPGTELVFEPDAELSRLRLQLAPGVVLHPAACDFTVVTLLIAARRQTALQALTPGRVFLPYARPEGLVPLARVLPDHQLVFDAPELSVEFPSVFLAVPLLRADAAMGKALREVAQDVLLRAAQTTRSKLEQDVRERLREAISQGDISARTIARQLHTSERTLRRRLEAEGLSLRALSDQVRHELALSLVTNPEASTDEVAARLGFSTAQAFHRAFRRWTGLTVQAYRASQRNG
jgi:AraC-like DNA-binding protein